MGPVQHDYTTTILNRTRNVHPLTCLQGFVRMLANELKQDACSRTGSETELGNTNNKLCKEDRDTSHHIHGT